MVKVLAFDLGAGSGRGVVGWLEDNRLVMEEIHRFHHETIEENGYTYWDIQHIFNEIKLGIKKANEKHNIESIGIDSWSVDFALLDSEGELLANPIHYRDRHTEGMMERVFQLIAKRELFAKTGIQFMDINTIYHLYAMKQSGNQALKNASMFLMLPEMLRYFLTGEIHSEYTNTTTTQLLNAELRDWDATIIKSLGLPKHIFQKPKQPGSIVGKVKESIQRELHLTNDLKVLAVAEHDTASAVVAVPITKEERFAYLSCGTWSLLGTEVSEAVISDLSFSYNMTNEGGIDGTFRLLKNIMGLWLYQESLRIWRDEGFEMTFNDIAVEVEKSSRFKCFVDPDNPMFISPKNMPETIQAYCIMTNQYVPETVGEIMTCILESLALKYRYVLEQLEEVTSQRFERLYMVGGGIQNKQLCQFTANAIQRPVISGPVEASSIGNIVVQLKGMEVIKDVKEARKLVAHSSSITTYDQTESVKWNNAYKKFIKITNSE